MRTPFTKIIVIILTFLCFARTYSAEERIWLNTKVNGKDARLCFDTGAEDLVLWEEGASRLGLKYSETTNGGYLISGQVVSRRLTEECNLWFEGTTVTTRFDVVHLPYSGNLKGDGVVGWWPLSTNIMEIDASAAQVRPLSELPKKVAGWLQLQLVRNAGYLMLEIPHGKEKKGILLIDTGSDRGVDLAPRNWNSWNELHPRRPKTLDVFVTPGDGLIVREQAWAREVTIGPLLLRGVPISKAPPGSIALTSTNFEASFGLAALKKLDLIVDGKRGVAYLQSKRTASSAFRYNRLGAVFVPTSEADKILTARVAQDSPAQEAGIRDGDILLKINGENISRDNFVNFDRFSVRAGTKMRFTLNRNGVTFDTTATLRDILSE
jgi:hypothetical protein